MIVRKIRTQVVIIGSGPGGYSAAFRCADLGMKTVIIEERSTLGGVCLNIGCIPSKTILHFVKLVKEIKSFTDFGIITDSFQIDFEKLRVWKENIISKLSYGLSSMARMRKVEIIYGYGEFINSNILKVKGKSEIFEIYFDNVIIASGSHAMGLPFEVCDDPRIWDSTDALELTIIPDNLLIIGSGIVGLEMATIYHALGSKVDLVDMSSHLIPSMDDDIIKMFTKHMSSKFNFMFSTKIKTIEVKEEVISVIMEHGNERISTSSKLYDRVLVAVGRVPNSKFLRVDLAGVKLDTQGFIIVNKQMRTSISHIFAIGDVVGPPMLAHKSIHEGHVAAEVIAGKKSFFNPKTIPSVIYTDPELAWVGCTEKLAKAKNISYESVVFPWLASGRAVSSNYQQGMTKLIFNRDTHKIIGGVILGANASELLGEVGLAIEMGCNAENISMMIHAHPTLYESIGSAASIYEGSITDIMNRKARVNNY